LSSDIFSTALEADWITLNNCHKYKQF